ncbi:MAG: anthranilate synthase component I family protein [Synechococcaceae cyanobacterium]|nr:anthranilate synthase component I family protein [Synechococcaceae cyanobacterium]
MTRPVKPLRQELPWWEPWALTRALAERLGRDGLVLLEGDGSALGGRAVLGVAPRRRQVCRGLPGDPDGLDPFAALARMRRDGGAWLGWLAYEAGAWVEPAAHWRRPDLACLVALRYDPLLHFDRHGRRLWLEGEDRSRLETLAVLVRQLAAERGATESEVGGAEAEGEGEAEANAFASGAATGLAAAIPAQAWHWHTPADAYADQVRQLQERIAAGDIFQANLTACCETWLDHDPDLLGLYARLRRHCPAPFAGLAICGDEAVLSASPERFLRLLPSGRVETRPIKGTRPRHGNPEADADAAAELLCDPKDRAENVMIVDLLRNDLGRVCRPGSITVPQLLGLESYAQVHHLTSVVEGDLAGGRHAVDLLRACWPGGSISGAPKLRACQRLAELEPVPRGPYCGSLFHWAADGGFDSNILIRTLVVKGRRLRLHAGGGIVADSNPVAEAEEMGWKIRPLLEALA